MRKYLVRTLLKLLNSRFLNDSPCRYEYVGNVDAFSRGNLEAEEIQRPGITVKQILEEATRFKSCPIGKGVTVIDGDEMREATPMDIHELRLALQPPAHQREDSASE